MVERVTWDDVVRAALDCPYLGHAVKSYESGMVNREQALMHVALMLSRHGKEVRDQCVELLKRQPAPVLIGKVAFNA